MTDAPVFIDTNIFLRFLTGDHERMSAECRTLFERAEQGEVQLQTSHLVLAEIVWTLLSHYRVPRAEVAGMLRDILALRSLRVDHKDMLGSAVDAFENTGVDFIDAYHAQDVKRRGITRVCSYDRDFDSLGVERTEPAQV